MQPKIHISFFPRNAGSVSALFYVESEVDVYGWYAASNSRRFAAAFFMAENFYAKHTTVLHRSLHGDVYGPWIADYPPAHGKNRCPVPEAIRHELERLQFEFVDEWLFFRNDPAVGGEIAAYQQQGLPLNTLNIKSKRLKRMSEYDSALCYATAGADLNVMEFLKKYLRFHDRGALV
ncbi:MAG: hypothetical protein WA924_09010 [Burkholderiaceae bacterium]